MPYDPSLPIENTPLDAAQMRNQLQGLKALIDAASGITSVVVDQVNTIPSGNPASVSMQVVGSELHFSFDLPQGQQGNDGPIGATGQPGEVSMTDLNNGLQNTLSQCSNNSNAVATLGFIASDPPTQGDLQTVLNKLDELINALRR